MLVSEDVVDRLALCVTAGLRALLEMQLVSVFSQQRYQGIRLGQVEQRRPKAIGGIEHPGWLF